MGARWGETEIREGVREGNGDWRKKGTDTNTRVGAGREIEAE